jgi:hypothetical protein
MQTRLGHVKLVPPMRKTSFGQTNFAVARRRTNWLCDKMAPALRIHAHVERMNLRGTHGHGLHFLRQLRREMHISKASACTTNAPPTHHQPSTNALGGSRTAPRGERGRGCAVRRGRDGDWVLGCWVSKTIEHKFQEISLLADRH